MPLKPHPTDPDKLVYVNRSYELDPRHALRDEYERGYIDGMQRQMQSTVDKAINVMSRPTYYIPSKDQRTWAGLTDEEMKKTWYEMKNIMGWYSFQEIAQAIEAKLKEKNT